MFPLALGREVSCIGKRGHCRAVFVNGIPAAMIEVQVRVNDNVDFFRGNTSRAQIFQQLFLRFKNLLPLLLQFIADTGFNQDVLLACANEHRIAAHGDAVELVRWSFLLPHDLGNDAEKCSTIGYIRSIGDRCQFKIAECDGLIAQCCYSVPKSSRWKNDRMWVNRWTRVPGPEML